MSVSVVSRFLLICSSEWSKWYSIVKISSMRIFFIYFLNCLVLFSLQLFNRLSKQCVWYAFRKIRTRRNFHMLKYFWVSLRFLVNFENHAADYERQRAFFANFFQTAHRNDSSDTPSERYRRGATFSCRILYLIPYGLRAVSKLTKCGHLFFATPKSTSELHPTENALLQTKNRTAANRKVHCIISFVRLNFSQMRKWSALHIEDKWTATLSRSEPHYSFVIFLTFFSYFTLDVTKQQHYQRWTTLLFLFPYIFSKWSVLQRPLEWTFL